MGGASDGAAQAEPPGNGGTPASTAVSAGCATPVCASIDRITPSQRLSRSAAALSQSAQSLASQPVTSAGQPRPTRRLSFTQSADGMSASDTPLSSQPPGSAEQRPASSLRSRVTDRLTIPEHTASPPIPLRPFGMPASRKSSSQNEESAVLRDSCPARAAPRAFDAPLRAVAGSAEWAASRSGQQPRPLLQIPNSRCGPGGRYDYADPQLSPGPATSPCATTPASSLSRDEVDEGEEIDSAVPQPSVRPLWQDNELAAREHNAAWAAAIQGQLPSPEYSETPILDTRLQVSGSRELFPPAPAPTASRVPDSQLMPPPPPLPPLQKASSNMSKVAGLSDCSDSPATATFWGWLRASMSFDIGARTNSGRTETPKQQRMEEPACSPTPEEWTPEEFAAGLEIDLEAGSDDSMMRPIAAEAMAAAAEEGSIGFPPVVSPEQAEMLARAIASTCAQQPQRTKWKNPVSMSTDCAAVMQKVRGYAGPASTSSSSNASQAPFVNPQPLDLARETVDRIQSLGTDLPMVHKAFLWVGLIMDLISKGALVFQVQRMARHGLWLNVGMILGGLFLSSAMVTVYWLSHYPASVASACVDWRPRDHVQRDAEDPRNPQHSKSISKLQMRKRVRLLGTVAAMLQLGSIFAATRALRTSTRRQRLVAMDLRGMRLADTVFLTLPVALLQTWIGMRCSHAGDSRCFAVWGHSGLNVLLLLGVMASLIGATLAFVALDLNDLRFAPEYKGQRFWECKHLWEIVTFFCYRITELGARITLLSLFAVVHGAWVFAVFGGHAIAVLLAIWLWPGRNQAAIWSKVKGITDVKVSLGNWTPTLRLPALNDAKLLLAALIWPPSCFVSDATAKTGSFWWRVRIGTSGRKPCWSTTLSSCLLPFPLYVAITLAEMGIMYGTLWAQLPHWATRYVHVSVFLSIAWLGIGVLWLPIVAICHDAAASAPSAATRAAASTGPHPDDQSPLRTGAPKLASSVPTLTPVNEGGDTGPALVQSTSKQSLASSGSSLSLAGSGGLSSAQPLTAEGLIPALRSPAKGEPLTFRSGRQSQSPGFRHRSPVLRSHALGFPQLSFAEEAESPPEVAHQQAGIASMAKDVDSNRCIEVHADCRANLSRSCTFGSC